MRLKCMIAPDVAKAMAEVRATLGEDAVIVATQELKDGSVRVTVAIESDDLDLAELLAAPEAKPYAPWLAGLAAHHEIPDPLRARLHEHVTDVGAAPAPALARALRHVFRFEPLGDAVASPLLLLGPPGAGKTASVAKLAARAVLAGRTVEVVSNDTARAGGLEQLKALLEPLRLAPQAAPDPAALGQLVRARRAGLLLIDSPGLNPFRPADIGRISALIEASGGEPVLVLPAGMCAADCEDVGHTYAALGARRLLVTKLDTTRRLGGLLAAAAAGPAFCDAGIGPMIGQGLCPLSAGALARLLLHAQSTSSIMAGVSGKVPVHSRTHPP